jgi:hypothetical protein
VESVVHHGFEVQGWLAPWSQSSAVVDFLNQLLRASTGWAKQNLLKASTFVFINPNES